MGSIARQGPALRSAVRQRRRARWIAVPGSSVGVVRFAVLVAERLTAAIAAWIALLIARSAILMLRASRTDEGRG